MDAMRMYIVLRPKMSLSQPTRGTVAKPTSDDTMTTLVPTDLLMRSTAVM